MTHKQYVTRIGAIQAILLIIATAYSASLLSKVPNPMPTRAGLRGDITQTSSPVTTLVLMTALTAGMMALFLALKGMRSGTAAKFNAAMSTGTIASMSAITALMFHGNAHYDLASDSGSFLPTAAIITIAVTLAAGLLGAALVQPVHEDIDDLPEAKRVEVPTGANASWTGTATMSTGISMLLITLTAAMFIGGALMALFMGEKVGAAIVIGCAVIVALATFAFSSFTVSVNRNGISYRSPIKVPNTTLSYADIESVEVSHITPGNWGGWGLRQHPGGVGLITRSGEGLRITHSGGRITEITCDNPEVGAGLAEHYMK